MNSLLQKLVETLFECDRKGTAGTLTIGTQLGSVTFQLEDGFLVNSQVKGPGQVLSDFLVSTGWISREEYATAHQMAKADGVAPWVAMLRMGLISEEGITQARFQLAAQRFSLLLGTSFNSIEFEPGGQSVAARRAGAQRAIPLVLEYLRIALDAGKIEPFKVPPYIVVRPSDRLKLYLDNLRAIIPGELPLPAVGGETYESLRTRYGAAADVLSILFWTGMLVTEEEAPPPPGEAHITVPRLFHFVRNLILLNSRDLMDNTSLSAEIACETGNLILEGFGAFESALYFYRMIPESPTDEDVAADRRVLLSFLAGRPSDIKVDTLPSRISSMHAGRETKAALLRYLTIYFFFKGKIREAGRCMHEAFIYRPYDFDNLSLFVQLFSRDPAIALGQEGKRGLEIESFNESEYPDVLPLAVSCARDNNLNELISWIMHEGIGKVQVNSQIFDQIIDIMRDLKWGPDLIEFITHFSISSDRKGWTNPLWTLGSLYSAENIDDTLTFAREAYEILIKTSSGKLWAFTKLVDIMSKIGQPNMMLELLERAFREVSDAQQKVAVGQKLATVLLEEFGELKDAAAVAAKVVEIDPVDAVAMGVMLKAMAENKLGVSSARRFVSAMLHSSVSASGEHVRWFEAAARAAEELLGAPDIAAALLQRIIEENQGGEGLEEIVDRKKRLDGITEAAKREAAEMRAQGRDFAVLIREKATEDPAEARRLISIVLKDPVERAYGLPCVEAMFEAGARPWHEAGLLLTLTENKDAAVALAMRAADVLPQRIDDNPDAAGFVEELSAFLKDLNHEGDEDVARLEKKIFSMMLAAQPFSRDAVAYYSDIAAEAGDVESLMQFEERRIATSRAQEKGGLYVDLATYADLDVRFRSRAPTFWQIAGSSLPSYPPVIFNSLQDFVRSRDYKGAALTITDSMQHMPRYMYSDLCYLASRLHLLAGDFEGYIGMVDAILAKVAWKEDLLFSIAQESMDGIGDDSHAVKILGGLLRWHYLNIASLTFAAHTFRLADKDEQYRDEVVRHFRSCIDRPFPTAGDVEIDASALASFFDEIGEYLQQWGYHADAVRCFERSILATESAEEKIKKLFRLADVYRAMDVRGVEGLLLVLYRIRRDSGHEAGIDAYLKYLASSFGISLIDESVLTSLLLGSVHEDEFPWVDLVMAGISFYLLGDVEHAARLSRRSFESYPDILEGGFFAAYCCESLEQWQEAADLYQKLAAKTRSAREASNLLKRASLIYDLKLARERESLVLLTKALDKTPEDDGLFHEIETRSMNLGDKKMFILAHEIVESHLPGKQTQRAFYYKYAKSMEEAFNDPEVAARILLQALALSPRRGPVVDSIVRVAMKIQKFKPISQAAAVLKSAGVERHELSMFIIDGVKRFLAHENIPSAYGLMADAIGWDPGLNIVEGVRLLPSSGPAGVGMARKLLDEWIKELEQAIAAKSEDTELFKRLDTLSDMRDILIETSEPGAFEERPSAISVPPSSIDEEWQQIAGHPDEEITLEMFPRVGKTAQEIMAEADFAPPAPVDKVSEPGLSVQDIFDDDLPSVIIDLPPEEVEAATVVREPPKVRRRSKPPPKEKRPGEGAEKESSADLSSPSIPPSVASKIIESIGKAEHVETKIVIGDEETSAEIEEPEERKKPAAPAVGDAELAKEEEAAIDRAFDEVQKAKVPFDIPTAAHPEDEEMTKEFEQEEIGTGATELREVSSSVEVSVLPKSEDDADIAEAVPEPEEEKAGAEEESAWDRAMAAAQEQMGRGETAAVEAEKEEKVAVGAEEAEERETPVGEPERAPVEAVKEKEVAVPAGEAAAAEGVAAEAVEEAAKEEGTAEAVEEAAKEEGTAEAVEEATKEEGTAEAVEEATKEEGTAEAVEEAAKEEGTAEAGKVEVLDKRLKKVVKAWDLAEGVAEVKIPSEESIGAHREAARAAEPEAMEGRPAEGPTQEAWPVLRGDRSIVEYIDRPWELDRLPSMLATAPSLFTHRSSQFLIKGLYSLFDSKASKFTVKDYRLIGKSGTSKEFASIVADPRADAWCEILGLIWDNAASLSIERLSNYGVSMGDQITPFSSGPVAPVIERAIRAFGYIRASVYSKREKKMQIDVVRTNPPAVVVLLPLGRIPASLDYQIGKNLWAASSGRILACTLPVEEGEKILEASCEAFGRHSRKDRIDPLVSSIVQDMWQIIPPRVQERLRGMIQGITTIEFGQVKKLVTAECTKAGFLFSGDLVSAAREFLPGDMLSSIEGDIPKDLLSSIIKDSEDMCRFIGYALSPRVMRFMSEFVI